MQRIIIGISGASGAIYGVKLLQCLKEMQDVETHLVISRTAQITLAHETEFTATTLGKLAHTVHPITDLSASVASGSFRTEGMIIAPCSMRTLGEIAHGLSTNLLTRAADVCLKERRKLVLLARETPLNAAHLKNMLAVTEMGGIIAPPVPAFYSKPASLDEMVEHTAGRVLDLFHFDNKMAKRWQGLVPEPA